MSIDHQKHYGYRLWCIYRHILGNPDCSHVSFRFIHDFFVASNFYNNSSVRYIGDYSFSGAKLSNVEISTSVTFIGMVLTWQLTYSLLLFRSLDLLVSSYSLLCVRGHLNPVIIYKQRHCQLL